MERFTCLFFLLFLLATPSNVMATPILFFQTDFERWSLPFLSKKNFVKSIDHFQWAKIWQQALEAWPFGWQKKNWACFMRRV
ncbi:hypothetical protein [Desulfosarcina variabilis]|uniref:hypothetical protein n=1 Tax=Desulfosarcina variabilis TaxID=2300 RepID=UPI003AFB32AF